MGNEGQMEHFIIIGDDIIGLYKYRIKCAKAGQEGVVIDPDNDKSYLVLADGSFENNIFPEVCDTLDTLLGEILELRYAYSESHKH